MKLMYSPTSPFVRRVRALAFEYSAFAVDGRPDLSMVVYNPAPPADAQKIASLSGPVRTRGAKPKPQTRRI
jgi:hypothetical protein